MKTFHWTALGAASSMVAVLVSAAVFMPTPSGTSRAQASFAPVALEDRAAYADYVGHAGHNHPADQALSDFDTASGTPSDGLNKHLDAIAYDLGAVLQGHGEVPRITLASLPDDLVHIREIDTRKAVFFKTVLPLVLQVNEQIVEDRKRLWELNAIAKSGQALGAVDRLWLAVMSKRYGTRRGNIEVLLTRHDVVPPSLALAQAATESAWGTSRFVREGNAMFGEWTFAANQQGIVPNGRATGKTHRVRAFNSLYDSVASYVSNLNKHRAYKEFRQLRAEMRAKGQIMDGKLLASTLHRYSERGAAYVSELHAIIAGNDLDMLDGARLSQAGDLDPVI